MDTIKLILASAILLFVTSCQPGYDRSYQCREGALIHVTDITTADIKVDVIQEGKEDITFHATHMDTGSGAKWEGGQYDIWFKQDGCLIEWRGNILIRGCELVR